MSGLARLHRALATTDSCGAVGRVASACGTVIRVTGLPVRVGALCRLFNDDDDFSLLAEVVGLAQDCSLLTPLGSPLGISARTRVVEISGVQDVAVGQGLLGRVVDGSGRPVDGLGEPDCPHRAPLYAAPPEPLSRRAIDTVAATGVRAIDSLLTCGVGQRTGIFATAGGGKSTLLGMLARGSSADVNVVALIGERGREVNEFIRDALGDSLEHSVVVVATSDRPPLERARAAYVATAIAEHFRGRGLHVQLLVDSITRYARALRDVGLAAGEPPARRGFPPSVFSVMPQLFERAGTDEHGAISAFYTVLVEDDDSTDPVVEEVRSLLDGHICLARSLAAKNHYPAIDVLTSASRLMGALIDADHARRAAQARELLAKHRDIELLVQLGEYQAGEDALADRALAQAPALERHLRQAPALHCTFDDARHSLDEAVGE